MAEQMVIKIMQQPAELPCHDCLKDCMGDEFMRCKKLKKYNSKIVTKEYTREELERRITNTIFRCVFNSENRPYKSISEEVINDILRK